ncbi:hypothetical protein GWK47_047752 [Chionoecetes opilio]|uniref:Uncharacterized protein n=1 Tax=Chionoecetes opilio TaxID=41210 RepID=A0A8J5CG41_CHIOP|nr:hypothetical protein GWK47_047752 [Chionoecetes opilio]
MANSDVLIELRQLRGQVRDLNLARSGHDDVVRDLGDAVASLKKENAELREELGKRGVPASPVPLPRRRVGAWPQVKNRETSRGRPQTPPPATWNSFAILVDECTEEGDDARYHADCRQRFFSFRSLLGQAPTCRITEDTDEDHPFASVVKKMTADRSRMWNSIELLAPDTELNGDRLSRRTLIQKLQQTFDSELIVLSSPGIADIIAFRSCASQTLRLVNVDEDDSESIAMQASKQIIQDVKNMDMDKGHYNISISKDILQALERVGPGRIRTRDIELTTPRR